LSSRNWRLFLIPTDFFCSFAFCRAVACISLHLKRPRNAETLIQFSGTTFPPRRPVRRKRRPPPWKSCRVQRHTTWFRQTKTYPCGYAGSHSKRHAYRAVYGVITPDNSGCTNFAPDSSTVHISSHPSASDRVKLQGDLAGLTRPPSPLHAGSSNNHGQHDTNHDVLTPAIRAGVQIVRPCNPVNSCTSHPCSTNRGHKQSPAASSRRCRSHPCLESSGINRPFFCMDIITGSHPCTNRRGINPIHGKRFCLARSHPCSKSGGINQTSSHTQASTSSHPCSKSRGINLIVRKYLSPKNF
jgi:hypothetical protein